MTPEDPQDLGGPAVPAERFRKPWVRNLLWTAGTVLVLYAMVAADVVLRAREAYREGEKYMRWHEHPDQKESELRKEFERGKSALDRKLAAGKIPKERYDRELEILKFDLDRRREESAVKYAYVWYQTAYELFSPPESRWVKLSRAKAPAAKEKWKEELRSQNIRFEDYMLE
ncbi:MAG: hypothetical protein A2636_06740 [Elusimicrobia bacterium RIFCSPHIGHO2_01_FULL_64_10]|nr:MAG: hypothetical protein A2636_06740 [Elusimicrobia bacterium RIFCSPHIGHO2_01_FULL_64_10]